MNITRLMDKPEKAVGTAFSKLSWGSVAFQKLPFLFLFLLIGYSQAQTFAPIPGLAFTKVFAGADPLQQTLTITSTGANFLFSASAATSAGGSWLSVSKGCGYCNTPNAVTVTVTATPTLAVGTYTGQVVVFPYSSGVSMTIPVTLTIVPSNIPFLDNLPGQMSFSMKTAGTTITSQTFRSETAEREMWTGPWKQALQTRATG